MAKRKRAKGAGRKPKGEFHGMRNPLSIRIPDGLREKLDGACKGSGRSLTQEVTKRLNDSFAIKAEPDPFLRAINYLIGQAAVFTGKEWKTNPWMFQVFQTAVSLILDLSVPSGEFIPPERVKQAGAKMGIPPDQLTPAGYGFHVFTSVFKVLTTITERSDMNAPSGSWRYAMPQAREALGIPFDQAENIAILKLLAAKMEGDTA